MKKIATALLLFTAVSAPAFAADRGTYLAVDLGKVNYSDDKGTPPSNPGAIRFAGGYHFTEYLGVEAGYSTIGNSTTDTNLGFGASTSETMKASSFQISAVGTYPINDKFDLFAKIGAANTKLDYTYSAIGATPTSGSGSATKTNLLIGVGAQYNINQHFGIRASYEDFGKTNLVASFSDGSTGSANFGLKVFSVGGVYNF
jgi:OOP family OmpA-OmpF porin